MGDLTKEDFDKSLRVRKIKNGTVIDHISPGNALNVLKIVGITGKEGMIISIAKNVSSGKSTQKDVVKIENKELAPEEINRIALISPNASINIIRNYDVVQKFTSDGHPSRDVGESVGSRGFKRGQRLDALLVWAAKGF